MRVDVLVAARGGHLEVLQWAHENGCPWNEWTCTEAAKGGHLEVLQWAHQNGCPWNRGRGTPPTPVAARMIERGCPGFGVTREATERARAREILNDASEEHPAGSRRPGRARSP